MKIKDDKFKINSIVQDTKLSLKSILLRLIIDNGSGK